MSARTARSRAGAALVGSTPSDSSVCAYPRPHVAHSYGLEVRRVWPLAKNESLTEDLRPKRIDVICRAANEHSVIVKIKETG
jgi:hypothetical protein